MIRPTETFLAYTSSMERQHFPVCNCNFSPNVAWPLTSCWKKVFRYFSKSASLFIPKNIFGLKSQIPATLGQLSVITSGSEDGSRFDCHQCSGFGLRTSWPLAGWDSPRAWGSFDKIQKSKPFLILPRTCVVIYIIIVCVETLRLRPPKRLFPSKGCSSFHLNVFTRGRESVGASIPPLGWLWQPQTASGFVAKSRKLPVFELWLSMVEQCEVLAYVQPIYPRYQSETHPHAHSWILYILVWLLLCRLLSIVYYLDCLYYYHIVGPFKMHVYHGVKLCAFTPHGIKVVCCPYVT